MPALDSCHHQVVRALRKDGWAIADKPKFIDDSETETFVYIDIEATHKPNGAVNDLRQIFVEVKCFPRKNISQETYITLGQCLMYRALLQKKAILTPLYLAIPQTVYEDPFHDLFRRALRDNRIMVLVVDLVTETITQWID